MCILFMAAVCFSSKGQQLRNTKMDGYRGIWFELNQVYSYGDKYSGGLGTYTVKHRPLAVYAKEADCTFFVYGGTTDTLQRNLLAMAGCYDHGTGRVCRPTVVYDKEHVKDPHDNPAIMIDDNGYIRVFVSGRSTKRKGIKLCSYAPYSIDSFRVVSEETFAYPQIWNTDAGYFHFFTKYTGKRELYFETSENGEQWTMDRQLAAIKGEKYRFSGHYQVSASYNNGEVLGTFFSRHINGHPDRRTDLYYLETRDHGKTWLNGSGDTVEIPVRTIASRTRVYDYASGGKNVYLKAMVFARRGNPVCLYLVSSGHEPGPDNAPYTWYVALRRGGAWIRREVCRSDHNYDMGSLYVKGSTWRVAAPTEDPPQAHGVGGEVAVWISTNAGDSWQLERQVTHDSPRNHAYIRRPLHRKEPFCSFWASGDPHRFGISELFFADLNGQVWKLPYRMESEWVRPELLSVD